MPAAAQAATEPVAATAPETIADVLASDNLDQFRDEPEGETVEPAAPAPKAKPGKPAAKKPSGSKLKLASEGDGEEDEPGEPSDEDTEPDVKKPVLPANEEAEAAAFSPEALATPEGIAAAREILLASREATEKRNHILDRYDMRSKRVMKEATALKTQAIARSEQVEGVAQAITRDLRIFREPGVTAKEKLGALSRLAGGRPGHEVLDELTAGILSDGKEQPADPRVRELERQNQELAQRWELFLQQQEAQRVDAEKSQKQGGIARVYAQIQEEASDADAYPSIAAGLEAEDWSPEEVAEMVAGADGIMVRHYKRTGERLDKSSALATLEARLARHRGTVERVPQGTPGVGTTKRPGSPARGAGRGTTIAPSVADRSAGSVRQLETREERLADLQRDPAALKQLFPMLG